MPIEKEICKIDSDCKPGFKCSNRKCTPDYGCSHDIDCKSDEVCIDNMCKAMKTDMYQQRQFDQTQPSFRDQL